MKSLILSVTFSLLSIAVLFSQNQSLEEGMKEGFTTYDKGEEYVDWVQGAEMLTELGKKHPNEWLPEYWASYFYTQISRALPSVENPPKGMTVNRLIDLSQKNFDRASKKIKNKTPEQESDFHALQSLIYSFRAGTAKDETEKKKLQELEVAEIKKAVQKNPNNPVIEVIIACDLAYKPDYGSLVAARALFLKAKHKFNNRFGPRYMSAHWNEEWLGYWLPLSEKGVKKLTEN